MTPHRLLMIALWILAFDVVFFLLLWLSPYVAEAVRRYKHPPIPLDDRPPSLEAMKRARLEVAGRLSEYRQRRGR